ncbi:MAG: 3D domain-containing protein [Acidobacteria bacterium]|nr:3D domain-containing protein [Acidobacteriota bacterium]
MKGLVRGGILVSILGLVAFIYAQTTTTSDLVIAEGQDSQAVAQTTDVDNTLIDTFNNQAIVDVATPGGDDDDKDKKLVKKTGMSSAAGMGASKGAFSATAYCFSGRTAMGHGVRRGLVAADPRVLRMGSRIFVNAGQWSGMYLVSDTGGAIRGKRLDIWVPSCAEARRFGRRSVQVYAAK